VKISHYKHFNYRLNQRYNLKITKDFYLVLCEKCKHRNNVKFIKKDKEKNCVIVSLIIKESVIYCVFDKEHCILKTCLLPEWIINI
jgi:hypothetical protein